MLAAAAASTGQLDIRAITSVAGNAPLVRTTANMRQIATLYGLDDVPLAEGQSRPLLREPMAAPSVHGESGLDGPVLPPATIPLSPLAAVDLMAKVLQESSESVTIVATGPLTNVATLLLTHPELRAKIGQISIMGGGLLSGNWTPAAEFNILVDPEAAQVVFNSGIPLLVAPLDATEKAYVLPSDAERVRAIGGELAEIVADWLDFFYQFHAELGYPGGPVHDPVAIIALTHPEILEQRDVYVQVETGSDYCVGATIGDFYGVTGHKPNARVAMGIDREAYVALIVDAVRRLSPSGTDQLPTVSRSLDDPAMSSAKPTSPQDDDGCESATSLGEAPPPSSSCAPPPSSSCAESRSDDVAGSSGLRETARVQAVPGIPNTPRPTIIDCDPGVDDVAALILAASQSALDVVGVTTVAGNVPLAVTTKNALATLALLGWDDVPVSAGAPQPLVGVSSAAQQLHAEDVHGADGLLGVELPHPTADVTAESAWDFIYQQACVNPGRLQIITLGPLTNIAIALIKYPDLASKIERIVAMGGAILAGNTTVAAEFNFYADPEAAARVLDSGVPVYLCPLDVTHQAYLTCAELEQIAALGTEKARVFAELFLRNYDAMAAYADGKGTPLHDPTAVLFAAHSNLFTWTHCFIGAETGGTITRGKTVTDAYSDKQLTANNYLVQTVDRQGFVAQIMAALQR